MMWACPLCIGVFSEFDFFLCVVFAEAGWCSRVEKGGSSVVGGGWGEVMEQVGV